MRKDTRMLHAVLNKSWKQHYKTAVVLPLTFYLTRHAGDCWGHKDELINGYLLWTPTHGHTSVGQPAKTYIHLLCVDTGYCTENLPRVMAHRDNGDTESV